MAIEAKRGCGYRKAGGLYLMTDGLSQPCERLPIPIVPCPTCGGRIKQTRSFQWIKIEHALAGAKACAFNKDHCPHCPVCQPVNMERHAEPKDQFGLVWIGESHYKRPDDWAKEAFQMGVSRRVPTIPKGFKVGKTWVLVAHPKAIEKSGEVKEGELVAEVGYLPAVCHAFRPSRVELVVTPSMKGEDWVKDLVEKHGVTLFEVPEDDPDHAPEVAKKSKRRQAMDDHGAKFPKEDESD